VSWARLDRVYVPSHMLGGKSPAVMDVRHVRPSAEDVVALRSGGGTKRSDHAAVDWDVRYSDTEAAATSWRLPLHLLQGGPEAAAAAQWGMQRIIDEGLNMGHLGALAQLTYVLEKTRKFCQAHKTNVNSERAKARARLTRVQREAEDYLGRGVRGTREGVWWCRQAASVPWRRD